MIYILLNCQMKRILQALLASDSCTSQIVLQFLLLLLLLFFILYIIFHFYHVFILFFLFPNKLEITFFLLSSFEELYHLTSSCKITNTGWCNLRFFFFFFFFFFDLTSQGYTFFSLHAFENKTLLNLHPLFVSVVHILN